MNERTVFFVQCDWSRPLCYDAADASLWLAACRPAILRCPPALSAHWSPAGHFAGRWLEPSGHTRTLIGASGASTTVLIGARGRRMKGCDKVQAADVRARARPFRTDEGLKKYFLSTSKRSLLCMDKITVSTKFLVYNKCVIRIFFI